MSYRYQILYTPSAQQDLKLLDAYLVATESVATAERILSDITRRIAALGEFPERGAIPDDLRAIGRSRTRQIVVGRNRVLYRVVDETVVITLIADGRRDMQALLRQRLLTPPGSRR